MATNNLSVTYYQTPSDVFRPLGLKTPEQEKNVKKFEQTARFFQKSQKLVMLKC